MSYHEIATRRVKAASTTHPCVWCGEPIACGQPCVHRTYRLDGQFNSERLHPECYAALGQCCREIDGDYYFDDGGHGRGRTDDRHDLPPEFTPDGMRVAEASQ